MNQRISLTLLFSSETKNILVNRQPRAADCEICLTHDERKASLQAPELDPMHFNSPDCADHTRKISLPWHRFQIFWRHDREFIGHILRIDKNRFIDASSSARSGSNNSTVFKYPQMYTILIYVLPCTIYKTFHSDAKLSMKSSTYIKYWIWYLVSHII